MKGNQISNLNRNVELLARLLNEEQITKLEAADQFNVEEVTITRALQYYRSLGIEAFGRKSGIKLFNRPKKEDLIALASYYLSIKLNSDYFTNSIKNYSKIDPGFFTKIILLAKAVKDGYKVFIEYNKLTDNITSNYLLKPYNLLESQNNWILHGIKEGETILKTFYLSRIKKVCVSNKRFKKELVEDAKTDYKEIEFKFNPEVGNELYYKIWFDDFEIDKQLDGFIILKTRQQINNRLAAWCISWWDTIQIIKPKELKIYIDEMINDFKSQNPF